MKIQIGNLVREMTAEEAAAYDDDSAHMQPPVGQMETILNILLGEEGDGQ